MKVKASQGERTKSTNEGGKQGNTANIENFRVHCKGQVKS